MYPHSVFALKMLDQNNKDCFQIRFERFWEKGDKLNIFQKIPQSKSGGKCFDLKLRFNKLD